MAINKVVYNNETLIDISGDTVTPATLAYGVTAHDSSGKSITGTADMSGSATIPTKVSDLENDLDFIQNGTTDDVTFGGNVAVPAGGLLKVVTVVMASSENLAANAIATYRVTVTPGDGWTAVCAAGYRTNSRYGHTYVAQYDNSTGEAVMAVRNVGTSSITLSANLYVLCVRTTA